MSTPTLHQVSHWAHLDDANLEKLRQHHDELAAMFLAAGRIALAEDAIGIANALWGQQALRQLRAEGLVGGDAL